MYYSVISKSGTATDYWRYHRAFDSRQEAEEYIYRWWRHDDFSSPNYLMIVKPHHKQINDLMIHSNAIRFNNNLIAFKAD